MPPRRAAHGAVPTPRWEDQELDAAALGVARLVRDALAALREAGDARWHAWLSAALPALEDGSTREVGAAAQRVRAAFGSTDSVVDAWPGDDAFRLRDATDGLIRILHARAAHGARPAAR